MKVHEILQEGGWATTKTQDKQPTPETVKRIMPFLKKFEHEFNAYLKKQNYQPIKFGSFVGSSKYWERDLKDNPEKEYGDIDVIFVIPRIEGVSENKNSTIYQDLIQQFTTEKKPDYLVDEPGRVGQNLLIQLGDEIHQVDLVKTFPHTEDWTTHRMTPQHKLKGSFMGFMYTALAEVLNLSIGGNGVMAKHIGDEIVSFKKQKVDRVDTISIDPSNFARHIFDYFYNRSHEGKDRPKISALLKSNPGIKREEVAFKDLAAAVKGLAQSFDMNGMYGRGDLKNIKDYDDFIAQIKSVYLEKAHAGTLATKFEKATSEKSKKRAEETKELLRTKPQELLKLL
jgi:hypothetical protein